MGYPKQVYAKAWQALNRRRDEARERAAAHREEIRRKLPEVERIERQMAATGAAITKSVVAAPNKAAEQIERLGRENMALQERRAALLREAGYPADYLEENYHCPACRDSGYIGARMCSCLAGLLRDEAHAWLGTFSQADRSTFEGFRLSYYPEESAGGSAVVPRQRMENVLAYCRRYAAEFAADAQSLMFQGQTGLGKTHLSLAIAHAVTELGYGVLYSSAQQLMDRLEAEKFSRSPDATYREDMDIVLTSDLLILDDLGTEFATSFTASTLYNIVNTRLLEHRPVIISTNLELPQIEEKYGQRMASRLLCDYRVIRFYGKDIRSLRRMEGNHSRA